MLFRSLESQNTGICFAENDNCGDDSIEKAAIGAAPGDPSDLAILLCPEPGHYTAIHSGFGGTNGIGIVVVINLMRPLGDPV